MSHQDLKPQVFNFGPRPGSSGAGRPKKVTEAEASRVMQSGGKVEVIAKMAPSNRHHADLGRQAKHLDEDHETLKVKTVDPATAKNIQKARQRKEWTQADLAKAINERQSVVTEYEQAKAVPNEQVLNRMEKALGVYLRGVRAGQPMEAPKPAPKPAPKN